MTNTDPAVVRIAMWSGPRNISTAMMRAWSSRHDTVVTDEPLYSYYLRKTGLDHPGRDEIIAAYDSDWQHVIQTLTGAPPGAEAHLVPEAHDPASAAGNFPRMDRADAQLLPDQGTARRACIIQFRASAADA